MLKTTVVIATYDRPAELSACVRSVAGQTIKPEEIIVVDDGTGVPPGLERECAFAGIRYVYLKKDGNPGLTASRNLAVRHATGDIIFFFDDDVVLGPGYIAEILKIYADNAAVGGVGGFIENRPVLDLKDRIRRFFEGIFLVSGKEEGMVLPSGFCTDYGTTPNPPLEPHAVDFLAGCAMSFRKKVFDELSFDAQRCLKHGSGEDKDFSYRVAKRYGLMIAPGARLLHLESRKMRPDRVHMGRAYVGFVRRFFKDYVKQGSILREILFWYALAGHVLLSAATLVLSPQAAKAKRLIGLLLGVKDILLKRA